MQLLQNDTTRAIPFLMVDSTDHITGKTGLTPTVRIGKNGAAGAAPAGTVSEIDAANQPGWYKLVPATGDVATLGAFTLHASAGGADPVDDLHEVISYGAIADALLARNQQGGSNNAPTVAAALAGGLLLFTISGTTLTARHGDGTVAYTRTLTRAVLDAISGSA